MASTVYLTNSFSRLAADGTLDLDTDTVKLALLTNAYTLDQTDQVFADLSTHQVANGSGYTTGGIALAGKVFAAISATVNKFAADNVVFTNLTKTFRWAVLYSEKTANSLVNPLICIILLDNTAGGTDISVSAVDYSIQWGANGIITWTRP